MKQHHNSGAGLVTALFVLLFFASVALNAILLVGCDTLTGGKTTNIGLHGDKTTGQVQSPISETTYLRDIAAKLGIEEPSEKTSGDIAFDLEQRMNNGLVYRGEVLSDDSFENIKDAILNSSDQAAFQSYHDFIRKVSGKKVLILE